MAQFNRIPLHAMDTKSPILSLGQPFPPASVASRPRQGCSRVAPLATQPTSNDMARMGYITRRARGGTLENCKNYDRHAYFLDDMGRDSRVENDVMENT